MDMTFVTPFAYRDGEICEMMFSKSFGYAIRGILFLANPENERKRVQLDDIAESLQVPRYFLGKVMKRLAKEGILDSVKGHNGGFSANDTTLETKLAVIAELMGDGFHSNRCVLHLGACNAQHPCPVHREIAPLKEQWNNTLMRLSVRDLLSEDTHVLLKNYQSPDNHDAN
jgi:Rrf2 family transcriptional regulator, iron-sulfur cluster assembly transcription factor